MRVYLIAPDLNTRGGFEVQLTELAVGLQAKGIETHVFIRAWVDPHHPYVQRMRAAKVEISAASQLAKLFLDPSQVVRRAGLNICLGLLSLPLMPMVVLNKVLSRRSWSRAWQGGQGRLQSWLSPVFFWDGLTWWLETRMDLAARKAAPNIIDVQHSMIPSAILYGKRRGLPVIYTEYGAPSSDLWPVWSGLVPVINLADFIIGRAEASLEGLRTLCGATRPSALVANAVTNGPATITECQLPQGDWIVITAIGRLSPEKGPRYLLEAFRLLAADNKYIRLVFAGDGPLRAALVALVDQWNLGEQIRFIGAFDDLAPIMRETHIVAHSTLNDGRSVSVLEAMAWGRPVVASRVGGIPELVEDDVTGLLVLPADVNGLTSALRRLVMETETRARLGRTARLKFEAGQYSVEAMVQATLSIYHQVLSQNQFSI
jgi:glycosyltransferase involved in cell wall biosynthesis